MLKQSPCPKTLQRRNVQQQIPMKHGMIMFENHEARHVEIRPHPGLLVRLLQTSYHATRDLFNHIDLWAASRRQYDTT